MVASFFRPKTTLYEISLGFISKSRPTKENLFQLYSYATPFFQVIIVLKTLVKVLFDASLHMVGSIFRLDYSEILDSLVP